MHYNYHQQHTDTSASKSISSIKMIIKINIIIIIIIIGSLRNHGEGSSENVFQTLSHLLTSLTLSNIGETCC